jgi:hypothetical protein
MSASASFILLTNRGLSENLEGRSSIALHRVLKHIPGGTRGCRLMVRDEAYVDQLRAEGVSLGGMGRLNEGNCFWDFSLDLREFDVQETRGLNAYIRTIAKSAGADLDRALGFQTVPNALQTRILDALMDSFPAMSH